MAQGSRRFTALAWGGINGALCVIISLALLPILESFFSRVTPITLLEVGDFNRPLLRRLMIEAPEPITIRS